MARWRPAPGRDLGGSPDPGPNCQRSSVGSTTCRASWTDGCQPRRSRSCSACGSSRSSPARSVFSLDVGEHLYNPIGSVHGGIFCTLLDSAMACAVHTTLPAGRAYTTLELKVNLVKPLRLTTPTVHGEGKVLSSGRRVATASGQILGPDGTLYAHGTTTCLVFELPAAGEREGPPIR